MCSNVILNQHFFCVCLQVSCASTSSCQYDWQNPQDIYMEKALLSYHNTRKDWVNSKIVHYACSEQKQLSTENSSNSEKLFAHMHGSAFRIPSEWLNIMFVTPIMTKFLQCCIWSFYSRILFLHSSWLVQYMKVFFLTNLAGSSHGVKIAWSNFRNITGFINA